MCAAGRRSNTSPVYSITSVACIERIDPVAGMGELAADAALLVDASDPASIADAVVRVIDDPDLRRDLSDGEAGRAEGSA